MLNSLLSALGFLTILPVGTRLMFSPERMVPWFPAAGLVIGILLGGFDMLASRIWPMPVVAVLEVIFLVVVTGALHLDGICDTADGFYGGKDSRERCLTIMKDSRAGAMGVVAVICLLAGKTAGISGLGPDRLLLLVLAPAYARGAVLFGFKFMNYCRPEGGTGQAFFRKKITLPRMWGLGVLFLLSLLLGWKSAVFNMVFILSVAVILNYYKNKMGCVTGDMLGGLTEGVETLLFITGAVQI